MDKTIFLRLLRPMVLAAVFALGGCATDAAYNGFTVPYPYNYAPPYESIPAYADYGGYEGAMVGVHDWHRGGGFDHIWAPGHDGARGGSGHTGYGGGHAGGHR